jgi:hypothetical protein
MTKTVSRLSHLVAVVLLINSWITLWDDAATAGNSLENCFPEYLAVMFSCCVGCQECKQIIVPFTVFFFFFNFGKNQKLQWAKSGQ